MRASASKGLFLSIDPRSRQPLQAQIYSAIRAAILEGALAPGGSLQSSRGLAADLRVSRTTTLLAYEQLTAEGYLSARRGSGTFVALELPDDLPRASTSGPSVRSNHPPLSRRGAALASTPPNAIRVGGPPRAFRLGVPALDLFPIKQWTALVNRRLRSVSFAQLDYGDPAGLRPLRNAIADHVRAARGTRCSADQVIVLAGAQRGLEMMCQMLLDPGDEAWMEEPGYHGIRCALVAAGARIRPGRVDDDGLDVEAMARRSPRAKLAYVTPSHQFPLGVPMSLSRRLALLKWATDASAWILEDDYDSEFRYGTRPIPCLHGLDVDGRVIYVGSFSKTVFPSLRLGFVIVPDDLQERMVAARRAADLHPPAIDQLVLADFMEGGHFERHLRRMRAAYAERLHALEHAAARYCAGALHLRPVKTGMHAVADLEDVSAERLFSEAAARGVELMPMSVYCATKGTTRNAIILGFAPIRPEAIHRGMERLAAAIEAARRQEHLGRRLPAEPRLLSSTV